MPLHPLPDPQGYGEDLRGNLERVLALAPVHCAGCADYHIRCVAHRAAGERFGIDSDRPQLVALFAELAEKLLAVRTGTVDIVIAGSADTGILATAAHAVATLGADALARCRFTVLDLCPTPLLLCQHYAEQHGLDFTSATVDLTAPAEDFPADMLILHSVFRFIDRDRQPAVLDRLASWIRPGGSMVFSNRIKTRTDEERMADLAKRSAANERFSEMSARGDLPAGDDPAGVIAGLERALAADESRSGEFRDVAQVRRLLEGSALSLARFDEIVSPIGGNGRPAYAKRRVLAVLERAQNA